MQTPLHRFHPVIPGHSINAHHHQHQQNHSNHQHHTKPQQPLIVESHHQIHNHNHHHHHCCCSKYAHDVRSHPVQAFINLMQKKQQLSSPSSSSSSISCANSRHPRRSFWNIRCCCLFSLLPDEIMLFNVFALFAPTEIVSVLSLVSTRWNWLAADRFLWHSLDLTSRASKLNDASLNAIVSKYGAHLDTLKLCQCSQLTVAGSLLQLSEQIPQLRQLHLCNVINVTDDVVIKIATLCPDLTSVSLFGCKLITDASVHAVTTNCTALSDLSLRGCVKITDAAFIHLHKTKLLELNISSCKLVTHVGLTTIANAVRSSLLRFNAHGVTLSDAGIMAFTSPIIEVEPDSPASSSSPSSPSPISPALTATSISTASSSALSLDSPPSSPSTSPVLRSRRPPAVPRSLPLTTLHLSSANPFGGNARVTDASVRTLSSLTQLQCLNLQGSSNITDEALIAILPSLPLMERLNLGGLYRVTDRTLSVMAKHSRKLTHLSLFQLFHITDAAVVELLQALPNIVHLDLHSCGGLTPALLRMLAVPQPKPVIVEEQNEKKDDDDDAALQLSALDDEPKTRSRAAATVSSSSSAFSFIGASLATLDLGSIRSFTAEQIAAFRAARPNVKVIHY